MNKILQYHNSNATLYSSIARGNRTYKNHLCERSINRLRQMYVFCQKKKKKKIKRDKSQPLLCAAAVKKSLPLERETPLIRDRRLMHLLEVGCRWIVSFVLIYDVHRNVERLAVSPLLFSWLARNYYSPILRDILIHERYRSIHFSKFRALCRSATSSYHPGINDNSGE